MALEEQGAAAAVLQADEFRLSHSFFRRPDKFRIGEDFVLFIKKLNLYFEAVELNDVKKRRLALLFNLGENAFRLAESVELGEQETWTGFVNRLTVLFERNQTDTAKRYDFNRRIQGKGETVDSFAVALREFGSKCGFTGDEYNHRLVDQFILGLRDRSTQNKLLQEPPENLDAALFVARRFEAANSTMETLGKREETLVHEGVVQIGANRAVAAKVCLRCNGWGHQAYQCPTPRMSHGMARNAFSHNDKVCFKCNSKGHIAKYCRADYGSQRSNFHVQSRPNRSLREPPICFNCGIAGHIAVNCLSYNENSVRPRAAESFSRGNSESKQIPNNGEKDPSKIRLTAAAAANKKKVIMIEAKVNTLELLCVVDAGASVSLLGQSQWELLKANSKVVLSPADIVAEAANSSPIAILGKVVLPVEFSHKLTIEQEFYVTNDINNEIILGLDCLLNSEAVIDTRQKQIRFPEQDLPLYVCDLSSINNIGVSLSEDIVVPGKHEVVHRAIITNPTLNESILEPNNELSTKGVLVARVIVRPYQQSVPIQIINPGKEAVKLYRGTNIGSLETVELDDPILDETKSVKGDEISFDLSHLQDTEKETMQQILQKYQTLFAKDLSELGATSVVKHKIDTGQAPPIKQLPRRLPNVLKPVVEEQVNEMLAHGVVRPSKSPWASPIVLVKKKDGTWRFCVDFRKVNDVTIKDAYPLPQINDLIDSLAGHSYFTTLDLASGYWQVELDESSKEKSAFVIPGGNLLEFNRMAFGLSNAVPTFQRLMARVLEGLTPNKCLVYLDDVLIVGRNFDEHCKNLIEVLEAIKRAGLRLKPSKCYFAKHEVSFLGFVISENGLSPDPKKLEAIEHFPRPNDLTELRRFLGMASYYRRFVAGFTEIVAPLNKLTQKNVEFNWNEYFERAFKELKEQLMSSPVLAFPDSNREFIIYTDASNVGVGAVLAQSSEEGDEKVISFASKAFSSAEKNWTATEKEAFAVVWALQYFHPYVYGVKIKVFTDHKALEWLRKIKHPNGKLARWILKLEQYEYSIVHRPGSLMQHADALSRAPVRGIKISNWSSHEFSTSQNLDPAILQAKDWLSTNHKPENQPTEDSPYLRGLYRVFDSLCIDRDLLCRKWIDATGIERLQIVVPRFLAKRVLKEIHESIGHFGVHKTFDMVQRHFYWPSFHKDVEEYCASCELCAKNKVVPMPRSPMKPIEVKPQPFYMVGVDIIGPLKTTSEGNRYILSVIDYYTKYAEAEPLPNQEAKTVVKALEQIFSRHGMPSVLLTDQGRNFESHLFQSMCSLFNIDKRRTTPYHPQSDGLCERFNGILKVLLRMKVNKDRDNWDVLLPSALLAHRVSKQESTGVSPFELLYGREPHLAFAINQEGEEKVVKDADEYLVDLRKRQEDLSQYVSGRINKSQEKQKENYDRAHRSSRNKKLIIGDLVLYKNFRATGLDCRYFGPFRVINVIENNCEIESTFDGKKRFVHCNSLKRFSPALDDTVDSVVDLESSDSEEELDCIVKDRIANREDHELDVDERPYNLRRNRRAPERYGIPIMDY